MVLDLFHGLGNQMFIYSFGEYCKYIKGFKVRYNTKGYRKCNTGNTRRSLDILKFPNVQIDEEESIMVPNFHINKNVINTFKKIVYSKVLGHNIKKCHKNNSFDELLISNLNEKDMIIGFFQTISYISEIEDVIRTDFAFGSPSSEIVKKYMEKIISCDSISLHIRRGDYVGKQQYASLNESYYLRGVNRIMQESNSVDFTLFVFSDDIPWVKSNMLGLKQYNIIYVDGTSNYDDLQLMSSCLHNVIANSTFSWWGAWLNTNQNRIVIAPTIQNWYVEDVGTNLFPKEWILLENN